MGIKKRRIARWFFKNARKVISKNRTKICTFFVKIGWLLTFLLRIFENFFNGFEISMKFCHQRVCVLHFLAKSQINCTLMHTKRAFPSNKFGIVIFCPISEYLITVCLMFIKTYSIHCTGTVFQGNIILDVNCETVTLKGRFHELQFYFGGQTRISRHVIDGTRFS